MMNDQIGKTMIMEAKGRIVSMRKLNGEGQMRRCRWNI